MTYNAVFHIFILLYFWFSVPFYVVPKECSKTKPNFSNRPVYLLPANKDWLSIAKIILSVEQQCKIYITGNNTGYTYKIVVTNYIPNSIRSCHMLDINAALKQNNLCLLMVLVTHVTEAKRIIMSDKSLSRLSILLVLT